MSTRLTMLFQMTTSPVDREAAAPRTSGWSESLWSPGTVLSSDESLDRLFKKRAVLLPKEANIVGFRLSIYDLVGNIIVPKGSSTSKVNYAGAESRACDQPQVALELAMTASDGANSSKINLRGIPDGQVKNGEYQPDSEYKRLMTIYGSEIADRAWCFLGRDLSLASQQVMKIENKDVTLSGAIGAVQGEDFMRFSRCYDDAGNLIQGSFLVETVVGLKYTLAGFPNTTKTKPGGRARVDRLKLLNINSVIPSGAVVRKVGRPFKGYRGRASKR